MSDSTNCGVCGNLFDITDDIWDERFPLCSKACFFAYCARWNSLTTAPDSVSSVHQMRDPYKTQPRPYVRKAKVVPMTPVMVRMPPDLYARVLVLCKNDDRSFASLVRRLIRDELARQPTTRSNQ